MRVTKYNFLTNYQNQHVFNTIFLFSWIVLQCNIVNYNETLRWVHSSQEVGYDEWSRLVFYNKRRNHIPS